MSAWCQTDLRSGKYKVRLWNVKTIPLSRWYLLSTLAKCLNCYSRSFKVTVAQHCTSQVDATQPHADQEKSSAKFTIPLSQLFTKSLQTHQKACWIYHETSLPRKGCRGPWIPSSQTTQAKKPCRPKMQRHLPNKHKVGWNTLTKQNSIKLLTLLIKINEVWLSL